MGLHVGLQCYRLDEPFATYATLVRLLAGMGHDVMLQSFRLAKRAVTVGAVVCLDTAVDDFDVATHVACRG